MYDPNLIIECCGCSECTRAPNEPSQRFHNHGGPSHGGKRLLVPSQSTHNYNYLRHYDNDKLVPEHSSKDHRGWAALRPNANQSVRFL